MLLQSNDYQGLRQQAHRLAGAAHLFNCKPLADAAIALERAMKNAEYAVADSGGQRIIQANRKLFSGWCELNTKDYIDYFLQLSVRTKKTLDTKYQLSSSYLAVYKPCQGTVGKNSYNV